MHLGILKLSSYELYAIVFTLTICITLTRTGLSTFVSALWRSEDVAYPMTTYPLNIPRGYVRTAKKDLTFALPACRTQREFHSPIFRMCRTYNEISNNNCDGLDIFNYYSKFTSTLNKM